MKAIEAVNVRETLRSATRQLHHDTDGLIEQYANVASAAGYPTFLAVMLDAITCFGDALDRISEVAQLPLRSEVLRTSLQSDLETLGASTGSAMSRADPAQPGPLLADESLMHAWGTAYTLEGSALGAVHLRRRVVPEQAHATSYLDSVVQDRRDRWPTFTAALGGEPRSTRDIEDMTTGAAEVFERIQKVTRQLHRTA